MKDIPVEVLAAVIGLLAGVVGVSVGALLQRRFERKHWERTIRLDAYDGFLGAFDEMFNLMHEKSVDMDAVGAAKHEATLRLSRVKLVGSVDAIHGAQNALFQMGILELAGRHVAAQGVEVNFDSADFKDIMDQRRAFLSAARADIEVKPASVPHKVAIPPTSEGEENDETGD